MSSQFATAVNCIDGRVQRPVLEWLQHTFWVDCVDAVTAPGVDGVLSGASRRGDKDSATSAMLREGVAISVNAHGSRVVAVAGHHDCAGNPVSKEQHWRQLESCVDVIRSWQLPVRVVGLWVNELWMVEVVCGDATDDPFGSLAVTAFNHPLP